LAIAAAKWAQPRQQENDLTALARGVWAFVFVFPKQLAVRLAQAKHTFEAANLAAIERISRIAGALGKLPVST
jgi:hypothetical protein